MADSNPTSTPELKTYHGNCHCGAFKFTIEVPELTAATECNCSICFKKAYKWIFPGAGHFTITKGDGTLTEYEFGLKTMVHRFCGTCGTAVQGKRHGMPAGMDIGVNTRCIEGIDARLLKSNKYDGTAREPQYIPPKYTGADLISLTPIADPKLYTGGCHCGNVTMALLHDGPVINAMDCDCSICIRSGKILVFSTLSQAKVSATLEHPLTIYHFGAHNLDHSFCPICGVSVYSKGAEGAEIWAKEGEEEKFCINLRCFQGVDWEGVQIQEINMKEREPLYVVPE